MQLPRFLFPFCTLMLLMGLTAQVHAQIQVSDKIGCVPLKVTFSPAVDTFDSSDKIIWDFGDGASSDLVKPNHFYIKKGTFTVTMTSNGVLVGSETITLFDQPSISLTSDVIQGCAPLMVQFTNTSIFPAGVNITGFLWDFGDGFGSTLENPNHTYTAIGNFDVSLTVATNIASCDVIKTVKKYISINDKINVDFKIDKIVPDCTFPSMIYVSNTGEINPTYKYTWTLPDGTAASGVTPPPFTINSDGTYVYRLQVDNMKGCTPSIERKTEVVFTPQISAVYEDSICLTSVLKIQITGNSNYYKWDFGPKADADVSDPKNPKASFKENGTYVVKLQYGATDGCKRDTTFTIEVRNKAASFTIMPDTICSLPNEIVCTSVDKSFVSYKWNGKVGGSSDTIKIPFITRDIYYYNEVDTVRVTLEAVDADGCTAIGSRLYKYQLPNAQFEVSGHEGIAPWTVFIKDASESSYPIIKWIVDWGDGTIVEYDSTTIKTASREYKTAGKYYINMHIINTKGCEDKFFGAWVEAHEPISDDVPPVCQCDGVKNDLLCYKQEFGASVRRIPPQVDAVHFNMGPTIGNCDQNFRLTNAFMYNDPGTYRLTATFENGGVFSEIFGPYVTVFGPKAKMDYQVQCDPKYTVSFENKSLDYTSIKWIVEGVERTDESFVHVFPQKGDYPVVLIAYNDTHGCGPDTIRQVIRLRDVKAVIEAPAEWCFNTESPLIATDSEDEVVGCKMGYLWSFPTLDKPFIVTDQDTVGTMMPPGQHPIVLTVRDVNGCLAHDTVTIISYFIKADFTTDIVKICSPLQAAFKSSSMADAAISQYTWNLQPSLNQPDITHVFTPVTTDSIAVVLSIVDIKGCKSSITKKYPTYKPVSEITFPQIFCEKSEVSFSATDFTENNSRLGYKWTIDGNVVSQMSNFNQSGFTPGTHTGRLEIVEESTGCTNAYDFQFYVTMTPKATIADLGDSIFCYPKTLEFFGNTSILDPRDMVTYEWQFGNGIKDDKINPVKTFGKGKYTVKLVVRSAYQCADSTDVMFRLTGPEGELLADKDTVCLGESIKYTLINDVDVDLYFWDFGQGEIASNISPASYVYDFLPPPGTTFASLIMYSDLKNCRQIDEMPIYLYDVKASFIPDTVCGNTMTIVNTSRGVRSAHWTWGDSTLTNTDSIFVIRIDSFGTYRLTLTIDGTEGNCRNTVSADIRFIQPPVFTLPDLLSACEGDTISIPLPSEFTYTVTPAEVTFQEGPKVNIITGVIDTVRVVALSADGCTSADSIFILGKRNLFQQNERTIFPCGNLKPEQLYVDSIDNADILWTIPGKNAEEYLSCTTCPRPFLLQTFSGLIYARVVEKDTCSTTVYKFAIYSPEVIVPNVFSPNNDAVNDLFRPVATDPTMTDLIRVNALKVYNRWGKEVFNDSRPWDGTTDGGLAPPGVYYFTMLYSVGDACPGAIKGDVTLIR